MSGASVGGEGVGSPLSTLVADDTGWGRVVVVVVVMVTAVARGQGEEEVSRFGARAPAVHDDSVTAGEK